MPDGLEPRRVAVEVVRELRASVLRPGMAPQASVYEGDEDPRTLHVAVLDGDRAVLGAASVMREGFPPAPSEADWRIRGMATLPAVRGRGLGAELLALCERHAREQGGERLWCNARVGARTLYERGGLRVCGGVFEIEGIGPHLLMCKRL